MNHSDDDHMTNLGGTVLVIFCLQTLLAVLQDVSWACRRLRAMMRCPRVASQVAEFGIEDRRQYQNVNSYVKPVA